MLYGIASGIQEGLGNSRKIKRDLMHLICENEKGVNDLSKEIVLEAQKYLAENEL